MYKSQHEQTKLKTKLTLFTFLVLNSKKKELSSYAFYFKKIAWNHCTLLFLDSFNHMPYLQANFLIKKSKVIHV